jgi:hypothetical protein
MDDEACGRESVKGPNMPEALNTVSGSTDKHG